jgi:hypothetical protein
LSAGHPSLSCPIKFTITKLGLLTPKAILCAIVEIKWQGRQVRQVKILGGECGCELRSLIRASPIRDFYACSTNPSTVGGHRCSFFGNANRLCSLCVELISDARSLGRFAPLVRSPENTEPRVLFHGLANRAARHTLYRFPEFFISRCRWLLR